MKYSLNLLLCLGLLAAVMHNGHAADKFADPTRAYAVPFLMQTPQGQVAMSWTEKDDNGVVYFYWALSPDKGKTFGDKQLIHSSAGIGNSRLMRPRLLFRKNGTMMAVFALRGPEQAATQATTNQDAHAGHSAGATHHEGHQPAAPKANTGGGRPRDLQIVYAVSKDGGKSWTQPAPVHSDKSPNVVRGFFDATVMANGEVAVAYLNDIEGKAHSRDLRFVTSSGDSFSAERTLDPFVCDCCPISLLVDPKGQLHMYYRENNDNVRDIATMVSTDNGRTFSSPRILFKDNWKVNGCPHSGPTSAIGTDGPLVAWFSGAEDSRGIRLVTDAGKRLFVIDEPTAKNAYLVQAPQSSVLLWEQVKASENEPTATIAYRTLSGSATPTTQFVPNAQGGSNASGIVVGNQLLVAYEVIKPNTKNSIEWVSVQL